MMDVTRRDNGAFVRANMDSGMQYDALLSKEESEKLNAP